MSQPELFAALALAQGEFKPIEKNRSVEIQMKTGGRYNFRYADLEEILAKTRPALAKNGLSLVQRMEVSDKGQTLICSLFHSGGGELTSCVAIPGVREVQDPKNFGASITYFRRYLVTALLGVAADDDLDQSGQEPAQEPAAGAFVITTALDMIEACETAAEVDEVFQTEGAKASAAKDRGGYAALRNAVREKKKALATPVNEGTPA